MINFLYEIEIMPDNRIKFITRRVSSVNNTAEISGIALGEKFIDASTLQEYYKHHITGEILTTGGGVGGTASASVSINTVYDVPSKTYTLGFANDRNPQLVAFATTIRFVTDRDVVAPDTLKIKIGATTYDVRALDGQQLAAGTIKAGMLVEAIYDGTNFRTSGGGFPDKGSFDLSTTGLVNGERHITIPDMSMDGWIKIAELESINTNSKGAIRLTSSDVDGTGGGSAIISYYHGTTDGSPGLELAGTILSGTPFEDLQLQKIDSANYAIWVKAGAGTSFEEYASVNPGKVKPYDPANTAVTNLPVGNFSAAVIGFMPNTDTSGNIKVTVPSGTDLTEIQIPLSTIILPGKLQVSMNGILLEKDIDYSYNVSTKKITFTSPVKPGNEIKVIV